MQAALETTSTAGPNLQKELSKEEKIVKRRSRKEVFQVLASEGGLRRSERNKEAMLDTNTSDIEK